MKELVITPNNSCAPPSSPCCGQPSSPCGGPPPLPEIPGYRRWPFVEAFLDTPAGPVPRVKTSLDRQDRVGAALARLGLGRGAYRVAPGLYAVGAPTPRSPVLTTANYKLTFDALRKELSGLDAWLLVLDTKGVNVWCAAGKGTFGTAELASRILATRLGEVVSHREVILPQLGAPGVAAHELKKPCGFRAVYGPVRAADIKPFLVAGMRATPKMRRVSFDAVERVTVGLVEFSNARKDMAVIAAALFVLAGLGADVFSFQRAWLGLWAGFFGYFLGFLAGSILTPLLLPWLPGRAFSAKGAAAGLLAGLAAWLLPLSAVACLGLWTGSAAAGSWYGMQFTGSSTYTSPTGVEREMRRAIPIQAAGLILSVILWRIGVGATP